MTPTFAKTASIGALVVASALASAPAAADPPPDLPPLPGSITPSVPAAPAPAPAASPSPAPGPYPYPGYPAYPTRPSSGELPPGYSVPYYYYSPYPMTMGQAFTKPSIELAALPPRKRHSPGMMAGGIVMVAAGVASVIGGAVLVTQSADRIAIYCDMPSFPCAYEDDMQRKTAGALLMAAGALVAAGGIPLWAIGAKMEVVPRPDDKGAAPKAGALAPELRVGPGSASLVVRF